MLLHLTHALSLCHRTIRLIPLPLAVIGRRQSAVDQHLHLLSRSLRHCPAGLKTMMIAPSPLILAAIKTISPLSMVERRQRQL